MDQALAHSSACRHDHSNAAGRCSALCVLAQCWCCVSIIAAMTMACDKDNITRTEHGLPDQHTPDCLWHWLQQNIKSAAAHWAHLHMCQRQLYQCTFQCSRVLSTQRARLHTPRKPIQGATRQVARDILCSGMHGCAEHQPVVQLFTSGLQVRS